MKVFLVEKQPNFSAGPIVGVWETISLHRTEQGARDAMARHQEIYDLHNTTVVMRVASREVLA